VGIDDLPAGKELTLMPNPAGDFLSVQHNLGKINSLEILSMDGKKESVRIKKDEKTDIEINIQTLKSGLYLLRIAYKDGIVTKKFIKGNLKTAGIYPETAPVSMATDISGL